MGHKVNPKIFRVGLSEKWDSRWFASGKDYIKYLKEDNKIRDYLTKKLKDAGVESIKIKRSPDKIEVIIHSSKPGIIIGSGGAGINQIKNDLEKKIIKNKKIKLQINIKEVSKPQLSARIVAQNVALELEKRILYRRAMKRNLENVMRAGAKGAKIICSGRLNGVEIARTETQVQGKLPLHTLRADIDYALEKAQTTYGVIGVKVWIYKGEKFQIKDKNNK